ncbi:DUF6799 domain-containing protein [Hymenobacter monticola]|uniref:DUF6799 domain-containing protein n=1 Tax=Hymenobacter monticola TaxID=1705399 RepID=A0ABY4B329_9BACT|nr:DUF6799 domain-containing protein [Hymenobacter monticola]UOE33546.1 hypothetical protein MTP16_20780 [Hymenobacter monticola]
MPTRTLRLCSAATLLWGALAWPAQAQPTTRNDGFRRHNGQMEVVRNGQPRPMTHDARLPTGTTVTKDGFVVSPDGQRTELAEGQGCDLRGRPVAVRTAPDGRLALGAPGSAAPSPAPRGAIEAFLSGPGEGRGWGHFKGKKAKKKHGKGKGHGRWKGEDD